MHLEHLNAFMERTRNYNGVRPQTTHSKSSLHLAYSVRPRRAIFRGGNVAWPFNFPWHFTKTCKAEVLFNLTYASDQLIKGVSWRTVNQNCAWVVLKLGGMPLNEKNSKLQMVTVKKQNIVREYVCCECATTKEPIHVQCAVFSFTHSNSAQVYSWLCVPLKHV